MSNYKQFVIADVLAADLKVRTGLTAVAGWDANGNPKITLGTATAGNKGCEIAILNQLGGDTSTTATGSPFVDIVGRSQPIYTSGVAKVVFEAVTSTPAFVLTFQTLLDVVGELARKGLLVELYTVVAGQNPVLTGTLTKVGTFDPNMWWTVSGRV